MPFTPNHHGQTGRRHIRRSRLASALAVAAIATAAAGAAATHATASPAPPERQLFDPGPSWAPDDGLMCEILERYDAADEHNCPTEPITTRNGPS